MSLIQLMIGGGILLLVCALSSKFFYRFGVPTLLIFLVLGMLCGSDGIIGFYFNDYSLASRICSVGLVFIMFYGGFGTNWKVARPVAVPSVLLSTLGVFITAILTGLFCFLVLKTTLLEGLLIGSVVSSTDAASVFSILRSRKLNLKGGLASLLEVESGSNDPVAYMMTLIILTLMSPLGTDPWSIPLTLVLQIGVGLVIGLLFGRLAVLVLRHIEFEIVGIHPIFVIGAVILSYSLTEFLGGNGYLSVYLTGIVLGNSRIFHKRSLVHFFDGISWMMQILLFFTLGLLSFPSRLPQVAFAGILIALFLIFIARPAATFGILSWFKFPVKSRILTSWVGLRGAASIAFAIFAINRAQTQGISVQNDIFHIVFFVALFSVAVQGTLTPFFAKKLNLVDESESVLKTFNDYQEDLNTNLLEYRVHSSSPWADRTLMEAKIPDSILIVMIRRGKEIIVPRGSTRILPGDLLVLSGNDIEEQLKEHKSKQRSNKASHTEKGGNP